MKRQTNNRHYEVQQGLSFLYRYYDIRTSSGVPIETQEAEYNVARMWHVLGLTYLAIPAYDKVLALSEKVQFDISSRASERRARLEVLDKSLRDRQEVGAAPSREEEAEIAKIKARRNSD